MAEPDVDDTRADLHEALRYLAGAVACWIVGNTALEGLPALQLPVLFVGTVLFLIGLTRMIAYQREQIE